MKRSGRGRKNSKLIESNSQPAVSILPPRKRGRPSSATKRIANKQNITQCDATSFQKSTRRIKECDFGLDACINADFVKNDENANTSYVVALKIIDSASASFQDPTAASGAETLPSSSSNLPVESNVSTKENIEPFVSLKDPLTPTGNTKIVDASKFLNTPGILKKYTPSRSAPFESPVSSDKKRVHFAVEGSILNGYSVENAEPLMIKGAAEYKRTKALSSKAVHPPISCSPSSGRARSAISLFHSDLEKSSHAEQSCNLTPLEKESEATLTPREKSFDSVLCPELIGCKDPLPMQMMCRLAPTRITALRESFKAMGLSSIGDLAQLSPDELHYLPIKVPKQRTVKVQLLEYIRRLQPRPCRSPASNVNEDFEENCEIASSWTYQEESVSIASECAMTNVVKQKSSIIECEEEECRLGCDNKHPAIDEGIVNISEVSIHVENLSPSGTFCDSKQKPRETELLNHATMSQCAVVDAIESQASSTTAEFPLEKDTNTKTRISCTNGYQQINGDVATVNCLPSVHFSEFSGQDVPSCLVDGKITESHSASETQCVKFPAGLSLVADGLGELAEFNTQLLLQRPYLSKQELAHHHRRLCDVQRAIFSSFEILSGIFLEA